METGPTQSPNRTTWTILLIREHVQSDHGRQVAWSYQCNEHDIDDMDAVYDNPYAMLAALETHLLTCDHG